MTAAEWLACTDCDRMVTFLRRRKRADPRRLRLYACGVVRLGLSRGCGASTGRAGKATDASPTGGANRSHSAAGSA